MVNIKNCFIYYVIYFSLIVSFSIIISIFLGIFLKNWACLWTTLLTSFFVFISKMFLLIVPKQFDLLKKKSQVKRIKKSNAIFKMAMIYIFSNIILIIPFVIVCVVVLLTSSSSDLNQINSNPYFNIWICLVLIILGIFLWIIINIFISSYKKKKINNKNQMIFRN